jgi:Hsp70 protein
MSARVGVDATGPVTVAVLRDRDGRIEPVLFDGTTHLPSVVVVADDGTVLTGTRAVDAQTIARRVVTVPLRLLSASTDSDDAGRDLSSEDLVAALLRQVRDGAVRSAGGEVSDAVLVVAPAWGPQRRTRLRLAAYRAGLTSVETVNAATAILTHLDVSGQPALPREKPVVVYRLLGDVAEATVLRATATTWTQLSTLDTDVAGTEPDTVAAAVADLVARALHAAEVEAVDVAAVVGQVPSTYQPPIAARLRAAGIGAAVRSVTEVDAAYGALRLGRAQPVSARRRLARHAAAIGVPLAGALALLWLLLHTGVYRPGVGTVVTSDQPPPYLYTMWPAWGMVAVLALHAAVAVALYGADRRRRRLPADAEPGRRKQLSRGLRIAAASGVVAGFVTAMLAVATYSVVPVWFWLAWTTLPVLILAGILVVIALLIQHGYLSAIRWQIWLAFPIPATVLMTAGLLTIHVYLLTNASNYILQYGPRLPEVDRLGGIAVGLAVLPLLIRRFTYQLIVSPVVVGVVMFTHSYTNTAVVIGVLLIAIIAWWLTRIRPASVFADPDHPATILATSIEQPIAVP